MWSIISMTPNTVSPTLSGAHAIESVEKSIAAEKERDHRNGKNSPSLLPAGSQSREVSACHGAGREMKERSRGERESDEKREGEHPLPRCREEKRAMASLAHTLFFLARKEKDKTRARRRRSSPSSPLSSRSLAASRGGDVSEAPEVANGDSREGNEGEKKGEERASSLPPP